MLKIEFLGDCFINRTGVKDAYQLETFFQRIILEIRKPAWRDPRAGGLVPEDSKCFCKPLAQRFKCVLSSDFIGFLHAGGILAHPARGQGAARRDDEGAQAVLKLLELSEAGIIYGMAAVQRLHQPGITP